MANTITFFRMAAGIVLLLCPVFSPAFFVLYIAAGLSDMLDGFVARKTDTVSELGTRLDTMADFVLVVVCLIKLLPVLRIPAWLYHKTITLKDGRACTLRNGTAEDGQALLKIFNLTHAQTDYLLTYPEEHSYTAEDEAELQRRKTDSADEIELLAFVDGAIVGSVRVTCVARKEKVRHRAEFGISVDKAYWGLGIGRALTEACIECAKNAGYAQLELEVVAENRSAIALYESVGFVEYGRNPKGFRSRLTGWQEVVLMRLELGGQSAM